MTSIALMTIFTVFLEGYLIRACADLVGEVRATWEMIYFVALPCLLCSILATRWRKLGVAGLASAAVIVVVVKTTSLLVAEIVQDEVVTLVGTLNLAKTGTGNLPSEIAPHLVRASFLTDRIQKYEVRGADFTLYHFLVTPAITHRYDSKTGWEHGDD